MSAVYALVTAPACMGKSSDGRHVSAKDKMKPNAPVFLHALRPLFLNRTLAKNGYTYAL